jgi:hypothetical protein
LFRPRVVLSGAGRSIHPKSPTPNTGHPQKLRYQGRLDQKRWGTSSNTNERPRNPPAPLHLQHPPPSRLLSTHTYTHSLTIPIAQPPTTITTHLRGKFYSSVITQFILRAPPKPHPTHTHTHACLALPKSCRTRPGTPTPAAPASDFDTREHVYIDPRDQFAWPLLASNVPPAQGKIVRFLTKSAKKRCSPIIPAAPPPRVSGTPTDLRAVSNPTSASFLTARLLLLLPSFDHHFLLTPNPPSVHLAFLQFTLSAIATAYNPLLCSPLNPHLHITHNVRKVNPRGRRQGHPQLPPHPRACDQAHSSSRTSNSQPSREARFHHLQGW